MCVCVCRIACWRVARVSVCVFKHGGGEIITDHRLSLFIHSIGNNHFCYLYIRENVKLHVSTF